MVWIIHKLVYPVVDLLVDTGESLVDTVVVVDPMVYPSGSLGGS